ncbi:MAG: PTS sugar transporter subunit IIA [Spirochaetaceae bacterium]|jgi:PTS system nitrogen regulatory IIA component|nr:PTS sugar transporter subunit IIA [Spirochaetaceae bacterium]
MTKSLVPLLERGGIVYNVEGTIPAETIQDLIARIKLPNHLDSAALFKAVLEREDLQPTSAGHGIALPHPRNPLLANEDEQFIAIGLTKHPLNWRALDGEPVRAVMLIVSSSARSHLYTLSKLHFFCSQPDFLTMLFNKARKEDVERYVAEAEKAWEQ